MDFPVIDLILNPDTYVCHWKDGELYVERDTGAN